MTIPAVAEEAIGHYLSKGLTKDVSVGIVSCLYYESKLNPGSQGVQSTETPGVLNPSGAYGIASWNGPRQEALASFAKGKGLDPSLLTTQLDFVLTECANSYPTVWAAIQGGTAYQSFIPIFVADYENPADHQKEINAAMGYANAWYPLVIVDVQYPATPPITPRVPGPIEPPLPSTSPIPTSSLVEGEIAIIRALAHGILASSNPVDIQALAHAILKELE